MLIERIRNIRGTRALVALVVAALCAGLLSSCSFSSKKTIYAEFPTAAGLFVGNDVGVLGVPVGTITAVTPEGGFVKVTMQIDSDQPIPQGAFATVVSRSVATDRYVELEPVFKSGEQQIADGGTVGNLDTNKVPVEFDQVLNTIGKFANQISGSGAEKDAIGRFLNATSTTLAGRGELINQAIKSLGAAVNGVSQQRDNATSTLVALDGLTAKLAANQDTIKAFVTQVSRASSLLASERNNFRDAISSATKMINVVAQFAKDNRAQITLAVNQTNDVLRTVNSKSTEVGNILKLLPLATENLQRAINKDQRLVVRLNLSALVPILGPLVGGLCQATSQLSLCQSLGLGSLLNPLGALTNILKGL
ncbi:MAG TPA: MCE family protein [Marmoricola sp.]|nr:MCE family protein [Marmoricola sp.]